MTCSCDKRAYFTRAEAHRVLLQLKSKGREPESARGRGRLQTYHCDGGTWHVGHAPMQLVVTNRRRRTT